MNEKIKKYPKKRHMRCTDTIGVPHPYMITARHVAHASDHFGGMLGEAAIEDAEEHGIKCGIYKGQLSYDQHEQAVLIEIDKEIAEDNLNKVPGLHKYLKELKPLVEADGFAGFAFVKGE